MQRRDWLKGTASGVAALAGSSLGTGPLIRMAPSRRTDVADGARVNQWLAGFDAIGRTPTGINRVAYSDFDLAGRAFAIERFKEAGFTPRIDAAGNILARLDGREALPPILIGSHVDSVTDGGNFDGPVGSFGALEVARTLRESDARLRHPVEVVVWANEEGGTIGSKLAVGDSAKVDLDAVARSGRTHRQGLGLIGGNVAALPSAVRAKGSLHAYIELHIEQGGNLEKAGRDIGVVLGIVGLKWFEVTVTGFANHAGATPMDQRQDAMLAAAKFTVAVNDAIRSEPGRQVATIGRLVPTPNTRNVIAGGVELTVDLRDLDAAKVNRFGERFQRIAAEIGRATDTTFAFKESTSSQPAMADPRVMDIITASAEALGLSHMRMPSGAGHDAQEVAQLCPMGMIFIPSIGGISHSPKEYSRPEDIVNGVNVLLNAVKRVDAL